jgi:cytochrome c oxidase subunit 2
MQGWHSALVPMGPQAARVTTLWWVLFATAATVWALVTGAMLWAAWRARRREKEGIVEPAGAEHAMTRWVAGAVGATAVILFAFLMVSFTTGRALATVPDATPITVEVRGSQWWWEFTYADTNPSRRLSVPNELHLPVGRPVLFKLMSRDVIHSFWVPSLHGKKDMIPGHVNITWFQADTPGVYRGECAEFCGHQHAKMAFLVIAQPQAEFERWYEEQLQPAATPSDAMRLRGEEVFLASSCAMCHSVRGTPAGASFGPELTHVGSRRTIASGTLPNNAGNLAGWIVDPQRIKPGAHMPTNQLEPADLQALVAYLQGLR